MYSCTRVLQRVARFPANLTRDHLIAIFMNYSDLTLDPNTGQFLRQMLIFMKFIIINIKKCTLFDLN